MGLTNQLDPDIAAALAAKPTPMTMNADGVLVAPMSSVDLPLTPGVVREVRSIPGDPEVAVSSWGASARGAGWPPVLPCGLVTTGSRSCTSTSSPRCSTTAS
jgi:hypothetical protein